MSGKPVVLRKRARRDIDEAVGHYLFEAGETVALDFIDALETARGLIGEQPGSGSPRYAHELDIPSLRFRIVGRFPYLIFYVERAEEIDVWRVLHGARDIPAWMWEAHEGFS
ncbi:MAG: type II toxin-antitoxin system RelE/ParE family toxin [Rhodospirillaceae bacterium]|nr:type II toxin-antitoxin system RelE/ParE family toxin [Rhodospirillaceae bacterium]MDE0000669.1 type II toxin-antitoxin system RelE/ParE family toxin [Rhodospirillaceae bacterium]MDE0361102.1 type II toxin-antitoxin system RelE/ParE family toxin [Rhodospirillaceae bacterium]